MVLSPFFCAGPWGPVWPPEPQAPRRVHCAWWHRRNLRWVREAQSWRVRYSAGAAGWWQQQQSKALYFPSSMASCMNVVYLLPSPVRTSPSCSLLATPLNHSHLMHRFPEAMAGTANVWHVPDDEGAACTTHEWHGLIHHLKHRGNPGLLRCHTIPWLLWPGHAVQMERSRPWHTLQAQACCNTCRLLF